MLKKDIIDEVCELRVKGLRENGEFFLSVIMNLQRKYEINTTNKGNPRNYLPNANTLTVNEWNKLYDIYLQALEICNLKNNLN